MLGQASLEATAVWLLCLIGQTNAGRKKAPRFVCRDTFGRPVDWFVAYKLPDISDHDNILVKDGIAFEYQDANTRPSEGWTLMHSGINETRHAIYYTVSQIYENKKITFHAMYNDNEPGDKSNSNRGHTKGVMQFDEQTGWWLIHSVPEFPGVRRYSYPDSGLRNGQSFMCVTFNTVPTLVEIAEQLFRTQPTIYGKSLPTDMFKAKKYDLLKSVVKKGKSIRKNKPGQSRVANLYSRDGVEFIHFAKHRNWNKDLYSALVAPTLRESIYTETWLNGPGDLNPNCTIGYKTQDILTVRMERAQFTSSKDHSKWAISQTPDFNGAWVCVGDINRQESQYKRGGGAMCKNDRQLWATYDGLVGRIKQCDGSGRTYNPFNWLSKTGARSSSSVLVILTLIGIAWLY